MAAPANDLFANAQLLTGVNGTVTGTTVDSTLDTPFDPMGFFLPDTDSVWYKLALPSGWDPDVDQMGASFSTNASVNALVWSMAPGETFPPTSDVEMNVWQGLSDGTDTTFSIPTPADDGYIYIGVGTFDDDGVFTFAWSFPSFVTRGIVWAPDDTSLEVNPVWVRLDAAPYNLASGFSIVRGRSSQLDQVVTGTATLTFNDNEGVLDPTNASSPFWDDSLTPPPEGRTLLDPMKQAAIALKNPVTDEWFTIFRGFVSRMNHGLDMWSEERGLDNVTWQLVDAFDFFANVILTHGKHGDTPDLATFPNIWYPGTPANSGGDDADTFVHVDDRIVRLLDDAGWPGTGNAIDVDHLRNIFSGNVSVQGVVYSRKDSMLAAIFDACDAEFPGVGNFYMSKEGVATFHGRFARFFPERPGYGINTWYVGSLPEAALDPDVAPHANPLTFYRTDDDIINSSYAIPQNHDESEVAVVLAEDTASQGTFGFRSENFDGLLVSAGHDDDFSPTTAVEEANKFSDYYVQNFSQPATRVGTLRFTSRPVDGIGGPAVWKLLTEIELGDVITLTSAHPGGGGFGTDFYVEQLRYDVGPGPADHPNIVLEVEVSPASYFAYNPFGTADGTA